MKCHFYLLEAKGAGVCQQRGRQMAHGCGLEIGWRVIYLTETENLQHLDVDVCECVCVTESVWAARNGTESV